MYASNQRLEAVHDDVGEVEQRGVVWVAFVRLHEGAVLHGGAISVPMPGVPRLDEVVDLGGDVPNELWRVVQVVWKAPVGFSESALSTLNLCDLPPVKVYVERIASAR